MALPYGLLIVHPTGRVFAAGEPANPWFSWQYVQDNSGDIQRYLEQHIVLTLEAVVIAMLIAFPLALLAFRFRWLVTPLLGATGILYTIPSLALFAFLCPFTGLKPTTVLVGLVIYALLVLVRNTLAGLDGVPADVRESARGMGYGRVRMLWKVELPRRAAHHHGRGAGRHRVHGRAGDRRSDRRVRRARAAHLPGLQQLLPRRDHDCLAAHCRPRDWRWTSCWPCATRLLMPWSRSRT